MNLGSGINIKNWTYFCSFARWYPDLFLDLIKPEREDLIYIQISGSIFVQCYGSYHFMVFSQEVK